ncbi:P-loop NTPase fold protein [Tardiphaga sp. 215_C5_N2_1]|jgi:ElaB/YqjD/DUF883 family membrane-anchored ribosome-binding protein|uniref:P-loop NTPase fold protein n=1 Tax=Tardiphaga sp. 215_C5_N2_1 TaxID=3240774 RepID=UPI003F8AEA47
MSSELLNSPNVERLLQLVSESVRASREGVKFFLEPSPGVLSKAKSRRHHLIFGRRGSGKSSLLQKLIADLTVQRTPIAFVDLEAFKGHSYPDVLVSILIRTLVETKDWLDTAATSPASKKSLWMRFFGAKPSKPAFPKTPTHKLSEELAKLITELDQLLHSAEEIGKKDTQKAEESLDAKLATGLKSPLANVDASLAASLKGAAEQVSEYKSRKIEVLHRNIMVYQKLFGELTSLADGPAYLLLDDLYHIRLSDQAQVIDYFHRIAKGTNVWLKVGTIRHRSKWYFFGNPSMGMKLGDDADEIDLDVTLEKFELTRGFLMKILGQFAKEADVDLKELLADGAPDRLVLASGGVARDFLTLFAKSVSTAQERVARARGTGRGPKVGAEDVNVAAGEAGAFKEEDFARDTGDDRGRLTSEFEKIFAFCTEKSNANCILVEKGTGAEDSSIINELVDLKFLHRAKSRVTVRDRVGKQYDAYMLDLSRYVGSRARRKFEIVKFWGSSSEDALRRASLVYFERSSSPETKNG